jgi:hypothetical protein
MIASTNFPSEVVLPTTKTKSEHGVDLKEVNINICHKFRSVLSYPEITVNE